MVAELTFGQTVLASLLAALFTALFVGIMAALVVRLFEKRAAEDRQRADQRHEAQLQRFEQRAAEDRQRADQRHEAQLQERQLEYQTRGALRETYAMFLVAQRKSRQA